MSPTPYIPEKLPIQNLDWARFIPLIGKAHGQLARYDGILSAILNPVVLLSPLSTKEAVLSSKIEGTQATLQEVLSFEANPDVEAKKYHDIQEILNYRKSMNFCTRWLRDKPMTLNMLCKAHRILLGSVRGQNKAPGEFRRIQNWIGSPGSTIENASFVPPSPEIIPVALDNFEKYLHYDEKDRLVQLAIAHAQFEIIHPFLDGNGRLGRMIIPLFLFEKELISSPMFYISEYFDAHKEEYYHFLNKISEKDGWYNWVEFFLNAVCSQAVKNVEKAKAILELYETKKEIIKEITHSQFSISIVDTLFKMPVFKSSTFIAKSNIPKASAFRYLSLLHKEGILEIVGKGTGRTPTVYSFVKLVQIVNH